MSEIKKTQFTLGTFINHCTYKTFHHRQRRNWQLMSIWIVAVKLTWRSFHSKLMEQMLCYISFPYLQLLLGTFISLNMDIKCIFCISERLWNTSKYLNFYFNLLRTFLSNILITNIYLFSIFAFLKFYFHVERFAHTLMVNLQPALQQQLSVFPTRE